MDEQPKKRHRTDEGIKLDQTAERFRTIFEHAPIMIDSFDAQGNCLLWNHECVRRLGWTFEEINASEDAIAMCYPDRAEYLSVLEHINAADGVFREYSPMAKDGTMRVQQWADFRLPDGTKISVGYDVTAQKVAEHALRESEEKYRQIFAEARDGIVLAGNDGLIVDCNPEFERQTGRPLSILQKMRVWELRPKEDVERAKYLFGQLQQQKVIDVSEQKFEKPNGETVIVELRGREVSLGDRAFKQAITRDITARKRTEAALHERDERLRLLVSQVPAVLWTTDRELRFTSSVGAGLESLGLAPGQVIGMSLYDYFETEDPEFEPIAMHRRVLDGESVTYLTEWDAHVFESHAQPLRDKEGAIIGCLALALDVTERVTAEKKLRRSEKQLRALASRLQTVREEESAGIAREIHDELGQNLTGLKMDIAWVQRRIGEVETSGKSEEVVDRLRLMAAGVDEIVQTIRRISTQLRPVILDDLGLLRALEWQATEFQGRTGIACDFSAETSHVLESDRSTAVFRIFQEILTNVARHADANKVAVKLRNENGLFVLDVIDDGKGISDDEMKSSRALGILGMQERAQVCGGDVVIRPSGSGGTRVTVKVPVG